MLKLPPRRPSPPGPSPAPAQPLPLRWAVIAMFTASAAGIAMMSAGPIAAIITASAVSTALHRILA